MSSLIAVAMSNALVGGAILAVHELDDPQQALHFFLGCLAGAGFTLVLERMVFPAVIPLVRHRRDE